MNEPESKISAELLRRPVAGHNLTDGPLAAQWGVDPTLLCFLRHLG